MPVEDLADRLTFLDPDEFGEAITWAAGPAGGISGIASTGKLVFDGFDGAGAQTSRCALLCRAADIGFGVDDDVIFRGERHTVKAIAPDGTGMALVRLEANIEEA